MVNLTHSESFKWDEKKGDAYEIAYPEASLFMNNADERLKMIIDKLNDDEWETLRDRFADFYVGLIISK